MPLTENQRENMTTRRDKVRGQIEGLRKVERLLTRALDNDFETNEELVAIRAKIQAIKDLEPVA